MYACMLLKKLQDFPGHTFFQDSFVAKQLFNYTDKQQLITLYIQRNTEAPFTRYNLSLVVKPVWQPVVSCIQTFNQSSNPFDNRFDKRLYRVYSRLSNQLNEQWLFVQHGCTTGLTTGWMFVYTIQPVVKPAVSCKRVSVTSSANQRNCS